MYCPKCGTQNDDANRFCVFCGSSLEGIHNTSAPSSPSRSSESAPASGWVCKHCGGRNSQWNSVCTSCGKNKIDVLSPDYTRDWIRRLLSSPLFLILTLAFSLQLLLNVQQMADNTSVLSDSLASVFSALEIPTSAVSTIMEPLTEAENMATFVQLLGYIPSILVVVGFWMLYVGAATRQLDSSGAKLIHTGYAIQTAVVEILLIICAFLLFVAYTKIPNESWYETLRNALGTAVIVLLIVIIVVSAYFAKLLGTAKAVENTIENGIPDTALSRTVAVLSLITGSIQVLSLLQGDFTLLVAITATVQILTGVAIFSGRSSLEALSYERLRAIRSGKDSTSLVRPKNTSSTGSSANSGALWRCRECGSTNTPKNTVCMICGVARPSSDTH